MTWNELTTERPAPQEWYDEEWNPIPADAVALIEQGQQFTDVLVDRKLVGELQQLRTELEAEGHRPTWEDVVDTHASRAAKAEDDLKRELGQWQEAADIDFEKIRKDFDL